MTGLCERFIIFKILFFKTKVFHLVYKTTGQRYNNSN